ncbi:MAG: putative coat protein [Alehxovirus infecundadaptatum]|uniref:Coat protein n=1 Tax=Leviviridae sp. TaxID=2027243 RepID=A0ABY3SSA8_9VIRU|nr:MAG: putative coat protein [Leviviridae sp.]
MLGNTFDFNLGGPGGTPKSLVLVNQDGYSAEYRRNEADGTVIRALIKHSNDTVKDGQNPRERHSITLIRTDPPSAEAPNGFQCSATLTLVKDVISGQEVELLAYGLTEYAGVAEDHLASITGWES